MANDGSEAIHMPAALTVRSSFPQVPKNSAHSGCAAIRAVQTLRAKGFSLSTLDLAVEALDWILS